MREARTRTRKTALFTAIVVLTNVLGNFSLSYGLRHTGLALWQLWVAAGVALLIVWMLSHMALLSWADLSFVLPVTSIGYVLAALAGLVFLNERISSFRWTGILFIMAGVTLVGVTSPSSVSRRSGEKT
ncbi:MAG: hypothetical protein WD696_12850 [Bryobacteraceae bacterium]